MRNWIEPREAFIPPDFQAAIGGHPLVARTLYLRGFTGAQQAAAFLDAAFYTSAPAEQLPDLPTAVARLQRAIRKQEGILVWGDFDVDGQTSTTILVDCLRRLGANVQFHIPVRETESHGVNLPYLEKTLQGGARVLLTCDTGITAHSAVDFANARGVDVLISDHHDLPDHLPAAGALVDPKRLPEGHPLGSLPGAGVAYKLAEALCAAAGRPEWAQAYLDLLALALVADLPTLAADTRYLLQLGLPALRRTQRKGLQAMFEAAEVRAESITEEHVGFVLAPRLNALGRLSDANVAVEFFTTPSLERARILAAQLESLNARRKLLTDQVFQAAQAQLEKDPALLEGAALVLAHPAWPAGVIGIVASRLVEIYNRPVILLSSPPGQPARGSARSVAGCNVTAAIAANQSLLLGYGGHPMAAGLSLDPQNISAFRRGFERAVAQACPPSAQAARLEIDAYLDLKEISLDLVHNLERLAPFGPGNPNVVLASRNLKLKSRASVGRNAEHLQLTVEDESGDACKVIWWQAAGMSPPAASRFDLAYTLRASDYQGQPQIQVEWLAARPIEEPGIALSAAPKIVLIDERQAHRPAETLARLLSQGAVELWGEATPPGDLPFKDRDRLETSPTLVIWSVPPSPQLLQEAVARVNPHTLVFFANDPGLDQPQAFLMKLAGLCKFAVASLGGEIRLSRLAAATAQCQASAARGVAWLVARGYFTEVSQKGDAITLAPGDQTVQAGLPVIEAQLKALLDETAAYRAYYRTAPLEVLLPVD